ncbi:uncharacterized protein [Diadema antillarum]|uniref:uncharacterized protein n=1 Tax=Diadema antillarum TaxID=105358 RepID=UPI003A8603A4
MGIYVAPIPSSIRLPGVIILFKAFPRESPGSFLMPSVTIKRATCLIMMRPLAQTREVEEPTSLLRLLIDSRQSLIRVTRGEYQGPEVVSNVSAVCMYVCHSQGVFSVHNYRHVPVSRNSATVRRVGNVYVFPYYSATRRRIYRCGYGAARLGCCAGWKRNSVAGTCTPICEDGCVHGTCVSPNQCRCDPGYTGSNCNADLNECGLEPRPCNQRCINTHGSYRCHCEQGYLLEEDGKTCIRDGRCRPGMCAYGCRKIGYRVECICPAGLDVAADGYHCVDIDECATGAVRCPADQRCVNTYGNFMCLCQEGYIFRYINGKMRCTESEDRCLSQGLVCDINASCKEGTGGVPECVCNDGYMGNGEECTAVQIKTCAPNPCFYLSTCSPLALELRDMPVPEDRMVKMYQCSPCPRGYSGDGEVCQDIDECAEGTSLCSPDADCTNTQGSYRCACREGFTGNGYICDALGCALPGFLNNGIYLPPPSSSEYEDGDTITFQCNIGYRLQGAVLSRCVRGMWTAAMPECIDVDECQNGDAICHEDATCINVPGSYRCRCNPGFTGSGVLCFPLTCAVEATVPNGMLLPPLPADGEYNNGVLVNFVCNDGYLLVGALTSRCVQGEWSNPFPQCVDEDECLSPGSNDCDQNANCINVPGSFLCECREGYFGNGRICLEVDPTTCADLPCAPNVVCTDLVREVVLATVNLQNPAEEVITLYKCGDCPDGYRGDGIECTNVDECAENTFECNVNARCVDLPGTYMCECNPGFYGDGNTCVAINPTSCADQPCFPGVACTDLDRAEVLAAVDLENPPLFISLYQCGECPPGYTGDGIDCEDVDECALNLFDCDINARCVNEPGSYSCECNIGFYGDGRTCVAINPTSCADQPCFPGVACTDLDRAEVLAAVDLDNPPLFISLYQCGECPPGYTGDGIDCEDVDECALNLFDCDINARCVNEPGSYSCECNIGFYGDGRTCVAINPTSCADQPCFPGVSCTDLDRAEVLAAVDLDNPPLFISLFQCGECPPGYTGDGIDCEDIDECVLGTHDCDENAECTNTPGSFVCVCNRGFYGDGRVCIPIDPTRCIDRPCFDNVICTDLTRGEVVGSIDLNNPVDIIYQYRCGPCPPGYRGDGKNCVDIDECAEGTFECHPNATCVNIPGSFECVCNVNFHGDGKVCIPLDLTVCAADGPCFDGVKCTNLTRSDVLDEIDLATFSPEELIKFYNCGDCPLGYMGDGEVCIDIDECDTGDFDCHRNASCENEIGGYTCVCIAGHFGNGTHCAQLDNRSCADNPCFAGVECTDIDPMDVDFTQPFVRLFECGECPEDYSGDGIECTLDYIPPNVNLTVVVVDHSDPLDELPAPDADVAAYVADPTQPRGTLRVASAVTGPDGVVTIEVPYNRTVIVTAGRPANDDLFRDRGLDNSMTLRAHRHIRNVVTIPLAVREEQNTFLWRSSTSNEFAFSGNEGGSSYRVGIPANGIRVPNRRQVTVEFYGVNITIPEAFEHAPELLAMIREGGGPRGDILSSSADARVKLVPLEVVGVMELSVFQRGRRPVSIAPSNPVTLQIPISKLPPDLSVGDRLDAWYYDEESAVWLKDGSGLIVQDPNTNELLWTYEATHFTWWAAGRPMSAEQSCVSVKACQDSACTMPVPGIRLRLLGDDFGYIRSRITDRDGHACFPFKYAGSVTVEAVCAMERASVVSTTLPAECERAESDIPPSQLDPNVPSEACREVTLVLPPLAANLVCNDPGEVDLTTRYLAGERYGDSVQYTCPPEQVPDVADGYRTCLECGLWSGSPVNCVQDFFKKRRRRSYLPGGQ